MTDREKLMFLKGMNFMRNAQIPEGADPRGLIKCYQQALGLGTDHPDEHPEAEKLIDELDDVLNAGNFETMMTRWFMGKAA